MKKLVSIALAGLSVAAGAAPEKLLEAIVTDQTTLVQHATKLGEMSGVPMIGMGAVGLLAMNPLAGDFGAMRPGADATVLVTLVGDPDLFDGTEESLEAFGKSVRYTILYPGSVSKADYLAAHTNAVDMGSVVKVDDVEFAAFSADGKWVATGNCEKGVGIALAKAGTVKLPGGETARVNVTGAGMSVLGKFIDMAVAEAKKEGEEMPIGAYFLRLFPIVPTQGVVFAGDFAKYTSQYGIYLLFSLVFLLPCVYHCYVRFRRSVPVTVILSGLFVLSLISMARAGNNPFLYLQF